MESDKKIGVSRKRSNFVGAMMLTTYLMRAKIMKQLEKYKIHVNPALDAYSDSASAKVQEGNAFLAKVGLPPALEERLRA